MGALIGAMALFGAVWAIVAAITADEAQVEAFADAPSRLPDPGPRDLHAVVFGTLNPAPVPRWT